MSNTTFTMRIDSKLKEKIQRIAEGMDMSSTALVKLVLRSFVTTPKLEIDLSDEGRTDTYFTEPVSADDMIGELSKETL